MIPKKIYLNYVDENDANKTWSEEPISVSDCKMENREYTDLSQVWHYASDIPNDDSLIIYESVYGDILLKRFTNRASAMANVLRWAYVNDLLPKGGEE